MINTVVLTGRLTKDPELKYSQSGIAICRFTLAVNRTFQSEEQTADFINCVAWRKQAENLANYLKKGSLAGIEGRIQTSSFDGKDGNRVFLTEVVVRSIQFLETKNSASPKTSQNANQGVQGSANTNTPNDNHNANNSGANAYSGQNNSMDMPEYEVSDDDLPF